MAGDLADNVLVVYHHKRRPPLSLDWKRAIMTKAFVLLSGGIDSTTCLHIARGTYDEVEAISIHYGQRHTKETTFAMRTCQSLGIQHIILDIGDILSGEGVMLTDPNVEIPDIDYADIKGVSPTYVPYRNGTLLSVVTAYAQKWVMQEIEKYNDLLREGPDKDDPDYEPGLSRGELRPVGLMHMKDSAGVFFGAHAEDAHNWAYPDCTPEFIGAQTNAIYTGTYYTVRLIAPLMSLTKVQVLEWGDKLGVDWDNTWSCYAGGERHCGTCPTCRSRRQAFINAFGADPTPYQTQYAGETNDKG